MVDRIQLILKVNNLTASRFADEIGVQRSSISHILSGRNMPSLDLIQKILKRFPEINSEWILNGTGTMMKNTQPDLFDNPEIFSEISPIITENSINIEEKDIPQEDEIVEEQINEQSPPLDKAFEDSIKEEPPAATMEYSKEKDFKEEIQKSDHKRRIEKIVIFYDNRTFREYFPEPD